MEVEKTYFSLSSQSPPLNMLFAFCFCKEEGVSGLFWGWWWWWWGPLGAQHWRHTDTLHLC